MGLSADKISYITVNFQVDQAMATMQQQDWPVKKYHDGYLARY
jgi:hypothetical protein